jgi:hypothetical protein
MPQCQFPVFRCFCVSEVIHRKYSRNWTKQKPEVLFFQGASRHPKRGRRGARGHPHIGLARPRPWPRHPCVRSPWLPSRDTPSPIRSLGTENPRGFGNFPERVPQLRHRRRRISGDRSLCSGTLPRRGSAPGAISISLHRRLRRLTAISINLAVSYDEKGVVHPRG